MEVQFIVNSRPTRGDFEFMFHRCLRKLLPVSVREHKGRFGAKVFMSFKQQRDKVFTHRHYPGMLALRREHFTILQ